MAGANPASKLGRPVGGYLERVVLGEDRSLFSWLIRGALWPLSMLYQGGLAAFLGVYTLGWRKRCELGVPVISVGNLTFGGTGKTPAVQSICGILTGQGKRVVVLSRGHGGSAKGSLIVSDGKSIFCESSESGDEPMLLAKTLPGVPVVVGKDRRLSGKLACKRFGPDVIVMDDGLQYWQLHRDLDVVVLNAEKPFGSGFVMPMGDLREPINGLKRAGVVLMGNSRALRVDELKAVRRKVVKQAPNAECFSCHHEAVAFRNVATGETVELSWIRKRTVALFCGIGRPTSFIDMLESLGAYVARSVVFADHHAYSDGDIADIISEADACGAEAVITTAKDLARLGASVSIPNLYVLEIVLEVEDSSSFASYICDKINR